MSPEMDLLDQLLGDNLSLFSVLQLFGGPEDAEALPRARHAITIQAREGLIQIIQVRESTRRVLWEWEIQKVLADDANWLKQGEVAESFLSITAKGVELVY